MLASLAMSEVNASPLLTACSIRPSIPPKPKNVPAKGRRADGRAQSVENTTPEFMLDCLGTVLHSRAANTAAGPPSRVVAYLRQHTRKKTEAAEPAPQRDLQPLNSGAQTQQLSKPRAASVPRSAADTKDEMRKTQERLQAYRHEQIEKARLQHEADSVRRQRIRDEYERSQRDKERRRADIYALNGLLARSDELLVQQFLAQHNNNEGENDDVSHSV